MRKVPPPLPQDDVRSKMEDVRRREESGKRKEEREYLRAWNRFL
jgi:hypothetical protein